MCRGKGEACGARRCLSSTDPVLRSAYRKGLARRKAAAGGDSSARGVDIAGGGAGGSYDSTDLSDLRARRELADLIGVLQDRPVWTGSTESAVEQARYAIAEKRVQERYGSLEGAVTALGSAVAARGEELAGVSGEQVRDELAQRYARDKEALAKIELVVEEKVQAWKNARHELLNSPELSSAQEEVSALERRQWNGEEVDPELLIAARTKVLQIESRLGDLPQRQEVEDARDQRAELNTDLVRHGIDDEGRAGLRSLADGYTAAIAELRGVGGLTEGVWHDKTSKKARSAFEQTFELYPDDWVQASNDKGAVYARQSKTRAHYSPGHLKTNRKRTPEVMNLVVRSEALEETRGRYEKGPHYEVLEELPPSHPDNSHYEPLLRIQEHQVQFVGTGWRHHPDPDHPPRGGGWTKWVDPADPDRVAWRRPKYSMKVESYERVPEIKTYAGEVGTGEVRGGVYSTAVHEMQHRFEHAVPELARLQRAFLERRAVDQGEELTSIYAHRRGSRAEMGYKDNFVHHYMGKVYNGANYEVLSMGSEALFCGDSGGLVGAHKDGSTFHADHDMRGFVLGLYGAVGRTPDVSVLDESTDPTDREHYEFWAARANEELDRSA